MLIGITDIIPLTEYEKAFTGCRGLFLSCQHQLKNPFIQMVSLFNISYLDKQPKSR